MTNMLETPREVMLGTSTETFRDYAHLGERGEVIIEMMQRIEQELDAAPDRAATDWARLATLADLLADVLAAQEQWLAEHDAALTAETDDLRRAIRNLNLSSGMTGSEAGS